MLMSTEQLSSGVRKFEKRYAVFAFIVPFAIGGAFYSFGFRSPTIEYEAQVAQSLATSTKDVIPKLVVTHLPVPQDVKAIYMTSWVAGRKDLRLALVKLVDDTELNSIVIDVKDYTGRISFEVDDPKIKEFGSPEKRISDIKEFIDELHKKNIYVIARISAFQDVYMSDKRPDLAVLRESDGAVWKDRKGISWLDAGSKEVWEYLASVGDIAYGVGFDELNFDYIRFPSDGNMNDISYRFYKQDVFSKGEQLRQFFAFLASYFAGKGPVLSADLFGMTTSNYDDLGIGQVLENALPYFDYVAPMVYPSHYPPNFMGFARPEEKPYEVVKYALDRARDRTLAASNTPSKIRPWLQDFDLGAIYTPELVRAQINATYDAGLDSWMLWSASNHYTKEALK